MSLNAAIEAAKTDIYGRSFIVVAKEVKVLSDRSLEDIISINNFRLTKRMKKLKQPNLNKNSAWLLWQTN